MKRKIITIDWEKCNGCGKCIPNCPEGALRMIDGKARLLSDLFCDGLGACIGHCPEGAIAIEERAAEPYDERKAMENIVKGGENTIKAHLEHLKSHNETVFYNQAIDYLREKMIAVPRTSGSPAHPVHACPGSREINRTGQAAAVSPHGKIPSQLRQWPVQLHLLNSSASFFENAELVIAADCTAYSYGNFHEKFINGKIIAIACPKLDSEQESYLEKLTEIFKNRNIRKISVIIMEVPCCSGLLGLAKRALELSGRDIPLESTVINLDGTVAG